MHFFDSSRFVLHSALLPTILLPEKRPFSLVLANIANLWSLDRFYVHSCQ